MSFLGGTIARLRRRWRQLRHWLSKQPGTRKINRRRLNRYNRRHKPRMWLTVVGLIVTVVGIMWAMMFITAP